MSAFDDHSGKMNSTQFHEVLRPCSGRWRKEVRTGPTFGVDTAVIDLGDGKGLAISSDPLSLIPSLGLKESAWLSVHLLANDMATTGFRPQYAQFIVNLPPDFTLEQFKEYWTHIDSFCNETGVAITGGHTAQVPGQHSSMPGGGTMFLQAPLQNIMTSDGARPGDHIVVTKESALAATAILARSFPETVQAACGKVVYNKACENFYRTSSLPEALVAAQLLKSHAELTAMHDVTEGGLLGGITEMGQASGCGFRVRDDALPAGGTVRQVAALFDIDHRYCVGAGAMLIAVASSQSGRLVRALREQSIPASIVGEFTAVDEGYILVEKGKETEVIVDGKDPYWNAFYNATEAGWK